VSRHSVRADPAGRVRAQQAAAAGMAVATAVGLAVAVQFGRTGLVAGLGVLQGLLVLAWVVGTGLPGRVGGLLIGAGAAAGADAALLLRQPATLAALLGVLALSVPVLLVHQLSRGVLRVRVTESLSGVTVLCTAVAALAAHVALARAVDGPRLVSATVLAAGLALVIGHLVDTVLPVPRLSPEVPHGLLGVGLAVAVGALVGAGHALGAPRIDLAGGATLGSLVGGVAALVAVGVGYLAQTVEPLRVPLAALAMPYLRVALPLAFTAPVGYLLGLYVTG
jgi:hypothetical protein